MKDEMSEWLPVAEQIKNLSLNGLLIFRTILDTEIAMRQESFYNDDTEKQGSGSLKKTLPKKTRLEVVK